jgi:CubicO group peptidase (beta-lactamase class C family)
VAGLGARDRAWSYEDIMSLVKPGYCKPGACYHYSNTNYVILGRVAEAVGGAPLHVQLRQRFFDPLGLDHTLYQPDEPTPLDAAHGHWASGSGHIDHTRDSRVIPFLAALTAADAAGAIASTASDLATWADALFGGRVLSRASLRAMTDFLPPDLYGLGARWGAFADHPAVGHRGGLRGYEASLWYFPGEDVSIALLSNQGNWDTDPVLERVARVVLGRG